MALYSTHSPNIGPGTYYTVKTTHHEVMRMAIPPEVLKVARPPNTVVYASRKPNVYGVRARAGCKRVGKRCLPINGKVVGHIIDLEYIPLNEETSFDTESIPEGTYNEDSKLESNNNSIPDQNDPCLNNNNLISVLESINNPEKGIDLLDFSIIIFATKQTKDIIDDLRKCYAECDAEKIICISILRAAYPGIKDCEIKEYYDCSVLHYLIPNVSLGKNDMTDFNRAIGLRYSQIVSFMRIKTKSIKELEPLFIDGTLKSDESNVNTLSDVSRKAKIKGSKDINLISLYSQSRAEWLCSMCFPGNTTDTGNFERFLQENDIQQGILLGDKGFLYGSAKKWFTDHTKLHFVLPLRRNSKYISHHNLRNYKNKLSTYEDVMYVKDYDEKDEVWLYSFHNAKISSKEQENWIINYKDSSGSLLNKLNDFGNIDLQSDLNLDPEFVYKMLLGRWEIEVSMRFYKMSLEMDETRVHSDASVIGSEFMNFLATIITQRMNRELSEKGILTMTKTYKKAKRILRKSKIARLSEDKPWAVTKLTAKEAKILQILNITGKDGVAASCHGLPKIYGISDV